MVDLLNAGGICGGCGLFGAPAERFVEENVLHSLETLTHASVLATDGEIGSVCDFLFDDRRWTILYVVVDVRRWLNRRDVVISAGNLDQPDWSRRTFRVHLTKEQVRHSPDVDSKKPVSRQQEIAMNEYFGWPAWTRRISEFPPIPTPAGREYPVHAGDDDPHLRSVEDVIGYQVCARHGEIGRVESYILDEDSWHMGYLDVKAGGWLRNRSVLIPTPWVKAISWADHRVVLGKASAG